jgi:predicted nucleic acid-binding Zn ribbon protein
VRRLAPRPLEAAVLRVAADLAPPTTLSRVQAVWTQALGAALAAEATAVAERDGTVTVACRDSTWANELNLMGAELVERLNDALEATGAPRAVRELRFRGGGSGC